MSNSNPHGPPSSSSSNASLPPFDWSLPGRNFGPSSASTGAAPSHMPMPSRDESRLPSTMERVMKFRDNQHDEDRVSRFQSSQQSTAIISSTGPASDSGIEQNAADEDSDEDDANKKDSGKRRRKRTKKKKKVSQQLKEVEVPSSTVKKNEKPKENGHGHHAHDDEGDDENEKVEIEYVQEDLPVKRGDPLYAQFFKVFENFKLDQANGETTDDSLLAGGNKKGAPKQLIPRDRTLIDNDDSDEEKEDQKKGGRKGAKGGEAQSKEEDNGEPKKKSKKQLKRETRLTVAQLKQLVTRPDVVEMYDVTAKDPKLLVFLKATRNTVPVPRHWCAKRKYLQGKRGIEKPPFQLPDFIRRTGIMEMREALQEKEQNKTLKQKMREKVRPKLGKIDIDYQKLHDAFFRWQTKPRMSIHGDLYYEGKENETRLRDKKPGVLSEELRVALGIPVGPTAEKYPPPWLIAMQRYGPPPSYPNLKIPGLNAPIPEGCSFGYHSGGWGKPPVDEHGRPLYGDVFGTNQFAYIRSIQEEEPVDKAYWGEIEEEEQEQEAVTSSEEEDGGADEVADTTDGTTHPTPTAVDQEHQSQPPQAVHMGGFATPHEGYATPSGTTSSVLGIETPQQFEIRKNRFEREMEGDTTPALYTVLPEKAVPVGTSSLLGTNRVYDFQAAKKTGQEGGTQPGGAGARSTSMNESGVDIALNPDELDLNTQALEARYRQELKDKELSKEDLSDMVNEHLNKQNKKRKIKQTDTSQKAAKKQKEFKF